MLHVRAFRPADYGLDLARSDGYVEYACLAESVIADAEYRLWARARTVDAYLGSGWTGSPSPSPTRGSWFHAAAGG